MGDRPKVPQFTPQDLPALKRLATCDPSAHCENAGGGMTPFSFRVWCIRAMYLSG
jgi:hypothetical protein